MNTNTILPNSSNIYYKPERCRYPDCNKIAKRDSQDHCDFCFKHGGGKKCSTENCEKQGIGKINKCVKHGGGKRCANPDCNKSAIYKFDYCTKHGGGYRCDCGKLLIHSHRCELVNDTLSRRFLISLKYK